MHFLDIKSIRKLMFLTLGAKKTFNHLRQKFIIALILQHFDLKYCIQIKTDKSNYAISRVLSQLSADQMALNNPNLINANF